MHLLQNDTIVFTDDNFLANALAIHTVTTSYPYNGTCLNSYYLSGSQCVKNLSYIPPAPPTPPVAPISYTNQTPSAGI